MYNIENARCLKKRYIVEEIVYKVRYTSLISVAAMTQKRCIIAFEINQFLWPTKSPIITNSSTVLQSSKFI